MASRLVPLATAQRGLRGFGGVTRGGPCVARGLGRATGDTTRKAGRARRPRGRSRWRPRSASFGGATWGGPRGCQPRSGHRRLPRRPGFGARHGGHDAKGVTLSSASRSIPLAAAQRGFRRGVLGGPRACRPRTRCRRLPRRAGFGALHEGRDTKSSPSHWRSRSAGFGDATRGGSRGLAGLDVDLAGFRVARGSGRASGDAT